jgi:hypothetical protein
MSLYSGLSTNKATRKGLLSPNTKLCSIYLDLFKSFSIFIGEILSPPGVIIISFFRSVIFKNSPSNSPISPVDNHPFF